MPVEATRAQEVVNSLTWVLGTEHRLSGNRARAHADISSTQAHVSTELVPLARAKQFIYTTAYGNFLWAGLKASRANMAFPPLLSSRGFFING